MNHPQKKKHTQYARTATFAPHASPKSTTHTHHHLHTASISPQHHAHTHNAHIARFVFAYVV
jgi:hypothetical protein